jgi:hypothetical protein
MGLKQAIIKALNTLKNMFPMLIGILLLISLLNELLKDVYQNIFIGNIFADSFI